MALRPRGRVLARALAVAFVAAILAQLLHAAFARGLVGAEAPDFALARTDGGNLRLSEYRSEVVALAFRASWCGQCREQWGVLERLQETHGGDGLRVFAVSFDEKAAAGSAVPLLMDGDGEAGRLYDVGDLPLVVLIDREGRVRGTWSGHSGSTAEALDREIRALLAE